ncbi:diacylglycerol/lipid kinase family protein [Muriicola soli]|uniref:Diacylglycerol kinase family lipid kinase n=1 Tax=Muriicola soli TaxID=2507538 RepID=A0A411E8W9_9FLAO|nr:diacylglycerol kinase family protein [Muriicola soli]QBA64017.1 diacylglycerol kinase family lipid kinase [Muriicola soli]
MKIVFVVNNKNNRLAKILPMLREACDRSDFSAVEFKHTTGSKHAIELGRNAALGGCDFLIGVGGDGTLYELVNGLFQSEIPPQDLPVLGLLPYGSANDFARSAGINDSIEELITLILSNSIKKIDLGRIILKQKQEIHVFVNIAGVGLGPEVVKSMEQSSKVLSPRFNYFSSILKGFLRYQKTNVSCSCGTWHWTGKLLQMAVANGRFFGNAICVAPEAVLDDGTFQLVIFGDLSIWDYLKNLGKLKKGCKIIHPEVHYYRAKEVVLESEEPCGIEADGEYIGLIPATLSIMPKAINFLMPLDS